MKFNELIGFKTSAGICASLSNTQYYPFHAHENYMEIICVLSGEISIYDSAVNYKLSSGELHIFNSTDPHKIEAFAENTCVLTVHIDKTKYLKRYKDRGKNLKLAYFVAHSNQKNSLFASEALLFRFLLAKTYFEYTKEAPSDHVLNDLAHQIIDLCFDQFHDYAYQILESGNYNIVRRKYDGRNYDEFYRIYRIADHIESHFNEKLTLTDIAEKEFLSAPYLSKYIKENIGITFSQLVSIARCSEAERLLANTNKPIEQIACSVGFANRTHLSTHFNRWFSKSPSKYRAMVNADLGDDMKIQYGVLDIEKAHQILHAYLNSSCDIFGKN